MKNILNIKQYDQDANIIGNSLKLNPYFLKSFKMFLKIKQTAVVKPKVVFELQLTSL